MKYKLRLFSNYIKLKILQIEGDCEAVFFFFGHFSVIDRFLYEMTKNFYVISDKMSKKYLAASLRVYSMK